MSKKFLAVEVDPGHEPYYWEIYDESDMSYIDTVEVEDFGDYLANNKDEYDFTLHRQEPYQLQYALHIELDKFFGQPDDHLDDCAVLYDPTAPLDHFCEGCKAYKTFTQNKVYGDYFGNPLLWNRRREPNLV